MLTNTQYQRCANVLALLAAPIITRYNNQQMKASSRLKSARYFMKIAKSTGAAKSKRNWLNRVIAYLAAESVG